MKIADLKLFQEIESPTKGKGFIINLGMRTVTIKYKKSTTRLLLKVKTWKLILVICNAKP